MEKIELLMGNTGPRMKEEVASKIKQSLVLLAKFATL